MTQPKYFAVQKAGKKADIYIFGDIVSVEIIESDVSSYSLARTIQAMDSDEIAVHINSYGGEVAEGIAIHNSLKNHKARIHTICDGFACSAASVVFMAGEERLMNPASLLMVHNAWSYAAGNAASLRKAADDLDTISKTAAEVYKACVNISEADLQAMLDNETWIKPEDAVAWGFATGVLENKPPQGVNQSAKNSIYQALIGVLAPKQPIQPRHVLPAPKDEKPQENSVMKMFSGC